MSGLELPTVAAASAAWFTWEPITPGECMTLIALALAAWGLWQMRTASTMRNKQLDAQEKAAADRHTESMTALNALIHGLETVIERTAPGAGRETA